MNNLRENSLKHSLRFNTEALRQAITLIELIDQDIYQRPPCSNISCVGSHIRHILDHYRALQKAMNMGTLNYDQRARNCPSATNKNFALSEINKTTRWLEQSIETDRPLIISTEVAMHESSTVQLNSTLERELIYIANHTIHHIAYMILCLMQLGVVIDPSIGVAPATSTYRRTHPSIQVKN